MVQCEGELRGQKIREMRRNGNELTKAREAAHLWRGKRGGSDFESIPKKGRVCPPAAREMKAASQKGGGKGGGF